MAGEVATVVVAAMAASEEATKACRRERFASRNRQPKIGQGWIRTSEGVKPADLQSAPFGHSGTYPFLAQEHRHSPVLPALNLFGAVLNASTYCRSLSEKFNDGVDHVALRVAMNLGINW